MDEVQPAAGVGAQADRRCRCWAGSRARAGSCETCGRGRGWTAIIARMPAAREAPIRLARARRFCGLDVRPPDRAALGLRRLRRGVHARRGLLEPRRRRDRAQGHDAARRASATRRTACPRPRWACSTRSACRTRASRHVVGGILPTLDFSETRFIANVSRLHDRGVRRGHARASTTRRSMRSRSTSPARTSRKAACSSATYPEMSARVVAACRAVTTQAADHQALAEPDRHPRERAPLHRGGHRRACGHQHGHGHGDRRARRAAR